MFRKKKLTKKDLEDISSMPYEKQVSLFKTRAKIGIKKTICS